MDSSQGANQAEAAMKAEAWRLEVDLEVETTGLEVRGQARAGSSYFFPF